MLGIDLGEGVDRLAELTSEIRWRGRSEMLCSGCDRVLPAFSFDLAVGHAAAWARPTGDGAVTARRRVALAFVADAATRAWADANQLDLLLPPEATVRAADDKLRLPLWTREARVGTPSSMQVRSVDPGDARRLWERCGRTALVAQLPVNNLTGAGTRLVRDEQELRACLDAWHGRDVKLSEYVIGLPLTVSGCVTASTTLVSGISHQLVGYQELTPLWGAHCGNQLVTDMELPADVGRSCRRACRAVGDVLRRFGFRGSFGLDLLASADRGVLVLEVNARFQSVTSLLNCAEIGVGLLPMPGVHVLALLQEELPCLVTAPDPMVPYSQVVRYARAEGVVRSELHAGRHELVTGTVRPVPGPAAVMDLHDDALLWPFVTDGEAVGVGSRLFVLQLPHHVAEISPEHHLGDRVTAWLDAVGSRLTVVR